MLHAAALSATARGACHMMPAPAPAATGIFAGFGSFLVGRGRGGRREPAASLVLLLPYYGTAQATEAAHESGPRVARRRHIGARAV